MGLKTRFSVGLNRLLARLSFGPQRVKLQHLIPELKLVMESGVAKIGAFEYAPNHFILYMSDADMTHHAPLLPALRHAIIEELNQRATDREWRLLADSVSLDILAYGELEQGDFDVDARIVEQDDPRGLPLPAPALPTPPPDAGPVVETVVEPVVATPEVPSDKTAPSARGGTGTVLAPRGAARTVLMSSKRGKELVKLEEELTEVVTAVFKVVRGDEPGRLVTMSGASAVFGRDPGADVCFTADDKLSRRHFEIRLEEGRLVCLDLGSGNGTRVNGKLLDRAFLKQGSLITAGETVLEVVIAPGLAA